MPQTLPPPPPTWREVFELAHRQWTAHAIGRPYDASAKRRWTRLLHVLEELARANGYRRP